MLRLNVSISQYIQPLLSLSLVASLIVCLAACQQPNDKAQQQASQTSNQSVASTPSATTEKTSAKKPDNPEIEAVAEPYKLQQTLYFNGDIVTMRGDKPEYAEALVEREGQIIFVGDKASALERFKGKAKEYDLDGKTLLPGFIDGHGHLYNTGFMAQIANILPPPDGPGADFDSLVETTKAWAESDDSKLIKKELGWIMANGYDDSQLTEQDHPTAEVLDRISTEYPVVLMHQSGHLAVVNSKALELAGYTKDSEDPKGGIIRRKKDGTPNGVLEEAAFFNVLLPEVMKASEQMKARSVQLGQEEYAKKGYTTAQDGRTTEDASAAFVKAAREGKFFIDVVSYPDIVWNEKAVTDEFYNQKAKYTNHYRIGGVKLTLDGSPQGKTAWLTKPYHVPPTGQSKDYSGYPIMPDDEAIKHVTKAYQNQWQILCHTNGDAAIDQYLKAVRQAQKEHLYQDHRTVMIHGQTLRKDQIPQLVELGMYPSLFPMHTFYWGDWHLESVLGEPRAGYISPVKDVIEAGLNVTSHHDAPVTFPNSMRVLDATVNRTTRSGKVLGAEQRVSVYQGLKTLTEWAAKQYFEEDRKGTLEKGKLADLVILDKNPLKIDSSKIKDIQVVETIKEGQSVYKNPEY